MSRNEETQEEHKEYGARRSTVIVEHLTPFRVITPIIVIIAIIAVMCVYTYFQKKTIIENAEQVTNQMADYIADNISNDMDYAESSIKFAASAVSQSMTSDTLENPSDVIRPMIINTPFDDIEYIRADGMNVMNIGVPFDASDRVYYTEGIKGNTGVWNNYHPKTSQETLMNFYTPIYYQGDIAGVLTGYIAATTQIAPLFETELYGHDIYGLVVDENDMVICSTVKSDYIPDLTLDLFMDEFDLSPDQKMMVTETIHEATSVATSHEDPYGSGRISVTSIPGTKWKVAIIVPKVTLEAIANKNTRDSVITIILITLILLLYAAVTLFKNVKRRREIAKENAKLEEENRIFDEENKRAFQEISSIRDIIASAHMGTWQIELVEGDKPRMYVDDTMKALLGVSGMERSPEDTYNDWYDNILPEAVPSVLESVSIMKQGRFDENTYLWNHPTKGERYVRCGGTARAIRGGYLLSGYHYDVDDSVREDQAKVVMLQEALSEKNDYYNTLGTLAGIYNSLHVIDLAEDTVVEFHKRDAEGIFDDRKKDARERIQKFMASLATDECRESALGFSDLSTLSERMQNKKHISAQYISGSIGWFLANFIALETDKDGRLTMVIFTTQSIDEAKKQEEKLINRSRTDELTGLLNRRAYEEDIYEQNNVPVSPEFVSMSMDVNGLKLVNDTLGHAAGDELLIGASECMKRSLGPYGKLYRTGGDEFIAILLCDREKLKEILADFDDAMAKWKGKLVDNLTVSYGCISSEEEPEMSVRELGIVADKRMYEAKSEHYRKIGVDRRGHQNAHKALCDLYTKILKINISDDTYQIVNIDPAEQADLEETMEAINAMGAANNISHWLSSFGTSGKVHPDDLNEYLEKTDIAYMREYFKGDKTSLSVFYRRKYGDVFKAVMMEIIPASDYSDTNQSLYLYVKRIDR
ncbi:MAG: sensor domain-containing diguanylate cyclase [Lachnospiraceae bacterium]|nr:sensor domain-containing diguanylate cyclase [Lachnospiraceae bacterium]